MKPVYAYLIALAIFLAADFLWLGVIARSFYAESKRVRNDRIKQELGVRLIHPDYRSGLAALLAAESEHA